MKNYSLMANTVLTPYSKDVLSWCVPFSCGDTDMDDFFLHDASLYSQELLGKSYNKNFQQPEFRVGSQMINFLKEWFSDDDNKTGCRFLVVDAYNKPNILAFYERNGFKFLHISEEEEREYYHIDDNVIHTRLMYYDLKC